MQHKPSTSAANDSERFDKIKSLNLKKLNWRIRAKVTESTGATESANGTRYIRVTFEDDSGKINAVAFGENVDKFKQVLTQDQTVKVSGAKLEKCDSGKKYAKFHKCKLLLQPTTNIIPCIASFTTKYTSFTALKKIPNKMITNCIGIIVDIGELEIKSSTKTDGKYVAFRKLTLVDDQKKPIELALWNEHAKSFCGKLQDVLAVKDLEVKVYKGNRQFSTLSLSKLDLNPDCFEANVLRQKNNNAIPVTDTPSHTELTTTPDATGSSSPERKKQKTDTPSAQRVPEEASVDNGASNHTKAKEDNMSTMQIPGRSSRLKKTDNDALCQSAHDNLNTTMHSVGALIGLNSIGTVFAVGKKYVMTAWHVVRDIVKDSFGHVDYSKLDHPSTFINFNEDPKQQYVKYYIQQNIPFKDEGLDVVVLEIKNPTMLPKPVCLCQQNVTCVDIGSISVCGFGQPGSHKKHIEHGSQIIKPNSTRVNAAKAHLQTEINAGKTNSSYYKAAIEEIGKDAKLVDFGYRGFDDESKWLFNCFMEHGASGSPLLKYAGSGSVYAVGVLTSGLPEFYFELPQLVRCQFPDEYRFEMGAKMSAVYKSMCQKNPTLAQELF